MDEAEAVARESGANGILRWIAQARAGGRRLIAMRGVDAGAARLRGATAPAQVITGPQELRTYEGDGLAQYKVIPGSGRPAAYG